MNPRPDGQPLDTLPLVYEGVIEERHIDRFGHVNVMWYTHFFDEATLGLFERLGCGPSYYQDSGHGMFAIEQHTRYLGELRLGRPIGARARVLGSSPKRIHFFLFLSDASTGALSATSELVGMHIALDARRGAPFPPAVRESIERVAAKHAALPWPAPTCGAMGP